MNALDGVPRFLQEYCWPETERAIMTQSFSIWRIYRGSRMYEVSNGSVCYNIKYYIVYIFTHIYLYRVRPR